MNDAPRETRLASLAAVLRTSWPASITMLNTTIIRFVDGWMVSQVGPRAFSAQLVAGMSSFVPESFFTGLLAVVSTYVSQNLGAGRTDRCGPYAWAGVALAWLAPLLIAPLAVAAPWIFGDLMGHAPPLAALEAMYFRYMAAAAGLTLSCRVLEQFFYGVHRPRIVLVASLIMLAVNVVGNWLLIYGQFGLPALGLEGAAIGTVTAWGVQMLVLGGVFLLPRFHERFATRRLRATRPGHVWDLVRVGWPAGINLSSHMLHWVVFTGVLVATFGTAHLAATTAVMRWTGVSFMPVVGIGLAATALVGRCIGEGQPALARRRTHTALKVAMVYMAACATAFFLFRYPMIRLFVHESDAGVARGAIIAIGADILLLAALFQLFDGLRIVYFGALRGAGDTRWPMVATILSAWIVSIGGGYAFTQLLPGLGSLGPWIAASAFIVTVGCLMAWRFESGAWREIDLLGHRRRPARQVPTAPPPAE